MFAMRHGHLAARALLASGRSARMASTFVGRSGRSYVKGELLWENPNSSGVIFKAQSGDRSFVAKHVPKQLFDTERSLADEIPSSPHLRILVDDNPDDLVLVYPYYQDNILQFIPQNPTLPARERLKILRAVAEAIKVLHDKDWIHLSIKPDNILVNWSLKNGEKQVDGIVLGDFDISCKSEPGTLRFYSRPVGNVMWRSPEAHSGRGITKASDMYSFGLVCLYVFGAQDFLVLYRDMFRELDELGWTLEQGILLRHLIYFGPEPGETLLDLVRDNEWYKTFEWAWEQAKEVLEEGGPTTSFKSWGRILGPKIHDAISQMTRLDPHGRMTIDAALMHDWWHEESPRLI